MVKQETVRKLALGFEQAEELPHFEKSSFRINKKIFATLDIIQNRVVLKLSEADQSVFTAFDDNVIYAVPNKWGKQGWTIVELKTVKRQMLKDALTRAYCAVAPKKSGLKYDIG